MDAPLRESSVATSHGAGQSKSRLQIPDFVGRCTAALLVILLHVLVLFGLLSTPLTQVEPKYTAAHNLEPLVLIVLPPRANGSGMAPAELNSIEFVDMRVDVMQSIEASQMPQLVPSEGEIGIESIDHDASPQRDDYIDVIKSRIVRAWERPQIRLDQAFHCRVRIKQGNQGVVHEVVLEDCDDDEGWQQSIRQAVRAASPLPAPPTENAFAAELVFRFDTQALSSQVIATLLSAPELAAAIEALEEPKKTKRSSL